MVSQLYMYVHFVKQQYMGMYSRDVNGFAFHLSVCMYAHVQCYKSAYLYMYMYVNLVELVAWVWIIPNVHVYILLHVL